MMKNSLSRFILFISFLAINNTNIYAQYSDSLSLDSALSKVLANNISLKKFEYSKKANEEMSTMVKAWEAPTVSVGIEQFPVGSSPAPMSRSGNMSGGVETMPAIGIQQMIPNLGYNKSKSEYYQSLNMQVDNDYNTLKNDLFYKAKEAYYAAYFNQQRLDLILSQEKILQMLLQITESRVGLSKSDASSVVSAKASIGSLQRMKLKESSMMRQAVSVLNNLMSNEYNTILLISKTINPLVNYTEASVFADSASIINARSDIKKMENQIYSMRLNQKAAKKMKNPMFGVELETMKMSDGSFIYNGMAMVTIPIAPWVSKGYKSEIKAIDYEILAMQKDREYMIKETLSMASNVVVDLNSLYQEIEIFNTQILPAYQKNYDLLLAGMGENRGDLFKTLMASNDLLMQRIEYLNLLEQTYKMEAMYEKTIQK